MILLRRSYPAEPLPVYDLLIERHTRSSTIVTSERGIKEWMAVFDEPIWG
jgi:hypothetical protein